MIIISVVRDFNMYNRLVRDNAFNKGATCVAFDNNQENKNISVRYNEFLDSYDYTKEDWLVFCHEDWEIKEDWQSRLSALDKGSLYAPTGVVFGFCLGKAYPITKGQIIGSNKDGTALRKSGIFVKTGCLVGTFDCQCLMVHSSLIKKHNLRFDENLSFDLYVEDFCINAKENYGIPSKIFQLECQHYSWGNVQPRFIQQFGYLKHKYQNAGGMYGSTAYREWLGSKVFRLDVVWFYWKCKVLRFLYTNKITKSNKRLIKICKIPVYSKRIKDNGK